MGITGERDLAFEAKILSGVRDAIIATDGKSTITYWNGMAEELFGWAAEEAVGRQFWELLRIEIPGGSREAATARARGDGFYEGEAAVRRKDGSEIWAVVRASVIRDLEGNATDIVSSFRDISGEKKIESALAAERRRFFDMLEALPAMVCLMSPDYRMLFVNRAFREKFGEPGGRRCYEFCWGFSKPCPFCEAFVPLKTGLPHRWECIFNDNYIDAYDFPFVDADGATLILEMDNDITKYRRAEKALKDSEERQAFLLRLSDSLRQFSDPVEIQAAATRISAEYFDADRCCYCEIEDGIATIRRDAFRGDLPSVAGAYPLNLLPVSKGLADAGQPFAIPDVRASEAVEEELRRLCVRMRVISCLGVPVVNGGKPVGLLCVVQAEPREWTKAQTELAVEIAERTWAAVERAKDHAAIRDREERLYALMKATSDVIYRMSPDWKSMTELRGRGFLADTERPNAQWLDKYIHPVDQAEVTGVIEGCIRDRRMFEHEHRVLRADGSIGWTYSRAVPLPGEDGAIREWFGAASDITARRRAEEALRVSEAKYRNLFDSIDEGFCIVEVLFDEAERPVDYRFLEVNQSFEQQTGLANAAGRRMRELAPDHEQYWYDIYGHIALTGEPARFQNPADALGHFYDVYAYRVGKPEQRRVAILFNDISARVNAEEVLREKTRLLEEANLQKEDILESIHDCFFALDRELNFTYVNKAAEEIWGIPRSELLGHRIKDVFPGLIGISLSRFRQAVEEQKPLHYEVFSKVVGRWGDMDVFPTREGISVYFRDTSERKLAEEALRRHEERQAFLLRLSDALRSLSDAKSIRDTGTRLLAKYLGASQSSYADYAENRPAMENEAQNGRAPGMREAHPRGVPSAGIEMLRAGRDVIFNDVREYAEASEELRARFISMGVRAGITVPILREGKLIASLSVRQGVPRVWSQEEVELVHDTAERTWMAIERARAEEALKQSEAHALALVRELEEADENKDQFISALSHELRNPLAVIVTGIELLDIAKDEKRLAAAKAVLNRQVRQLCALVDDLLDLTRISKNQIKLKKEGIELNSLAAQTAVDQEGLLAESGIRLHVIAAREPIRIHADPVRIRQGIGNLLSNAQKYNRPGGEVTLRVYREGDEAVISVKDTGIGVSPEIMPRLFQPFTQADLTLDRRNGGLGLGLSITKGIAELHGGSVSAHSEGLGKGSEFAIRLPLARGADDGAADGAEGRAEARSLGILIIEDNRDFADLLSAMLSSMGHRVAIACDGWEGVKRAREIKPDVILCDIGLPGMSGYDVARAIAGGGEWKDARLVAMTGYAGEGDIERAKKAGFHGHLAKPVDLAALRQLLGEC